MKSELNDFQLDNVFGGLNFSRSSENEGVITYNGVKYPFHDYAGVVSVVSNLVNQGITSDDEFMKALKAAGLI